MQASAFIGAVWGNFHASAGCVRGALACGDVYVASSSGRPVCVATRVLALSDGAASRIGGLQDSTGGNLEDLARQQAKSEAVKPFNLKVAARKQINSRPFSTALDIIQPLHVLTLVQSYRVAVAVLQHTAYALVVTTTSRHSAIDVIFHISQYCAPWKY